METLETLAEVLRRRAAAEPDRTVFTFLREAGEEAITFSALERRAAAVAGLLRARGVEAGDRVLVACPPGPDYVASFFGCLAAGAIAVPSYPPSPADLKSLAGGARRARPRSIAGLLSILEDSGARAGFASEALCRRLGAMDRAALGPLGAVDWLVAPPAAAAAEAAPPAPGGGELAFLQYTSGSTSAPRGVEVTHRSLAANLEALFERFRHHRGTVNVSWLPPYHDLGLIGTLLSPVHSGFHSVVMAPDFFVQRPARWLEAVTRFRGTSMMAPNFAYDLCARKVSEAQRAGLDLSTVEMMLNGAEPIRMETMERFFAAFQPHGLRRAAFTPAYGLAENTLVVSAAAAERTRWVSRAALARDEAIDAGPGPDAQCVVSCGPAVRGTGISIVDPERGAPLPPRRVGEIWVSGASVARGYWHKPEATAGTFGGGTLRTGDLGFLDEEGALYITGRVKDLIKVRGVNRYPQDLEQTAEACHPLMRANSAAAFSVEEGGEERVVVLVEVPRTLRAGEEGELAELARSVRRAVIEEHDLAPHVVALIPPVSLRKTSSGKIQRRACRQAYLDGSLEVLFALREEAAPAAAAGPAPEAIRSAPAAARPALVEAYLLDRAARLSRQGGLDPGLPLGAQGFDSLRAFELQGQLQEELGTALPLRRLFEGTLRELSQEIAAALEAARPGAADGRLQGAGTARFEPFPLTEVQQAYWVGRSPGFELSGVSVHGYVELEGDLEVARLEDALNAVVLRHDMLRAIVRPDGTQQVLPTVARYRIPVAEGEDPLPAIRQRLSHQVLPADRWPLFEVQAVRLRPGAVRLCVSFDLMMMDLSSVLIVMRELLALLREPDAPLPPPPDVTFRDLVLQGLQQRDGAAYQASLEYWRARLPSLPPPPALPVLPVQGVRPEFRRRSGRLSPEAWAALKRRATRAGVTPSACLMAAYAEALAAWSADPRFTLNVTLFNRPPVHPQVNQVVGDFTTLLLLEAGAPPGEPFEDRAVRLQEQLWADLEHRRVSGVTILRELARSQPGRALMPVVFTSALGTGELSPDDLLSVGRLQQAISQTPQVYLDHVVFEVGGGLYWSWDAVEALFPEGMLDAMHGAYQALLGRLAGGDEAWRAPPMAAPEAHLRLQETMNATAGPLPRERLESGFLRQADARPDALAVVSGSARLTYGELRARAGAVAAAVAGAGVRRGGLVAVALEKGWEQVAAVLGILSAGAAYLPVDPDQPKDRLHDLLRRGEVQVAVTASSLASLELPEGTRRILVDRLEPRPAPPLPPAGDLADLAYVIFTSGSTGRPKGVMIDHRGAANTIADVNERLRVGPADRVIGLSALTFDLSVWDVFGTLAAGGTLVLPEAGRSRDPAHWAELCRAHGVTVWNSVPALMDLLVDYASLHPGAAGDSLRLVMMSGDWIPVRLPDRIRGLFPGAEQWSLGGATEASIWSVWYPIQRVDPAWKSVPYGHAMRNQGLHVLDGRLEPRPCWVPGELYIGGVGVALGYLGDEATTREKFITHPRTGQRLYRTGDWARLLPDGELEFLGRQDLQVKVNGYRLELGEIEAALLAHPAVKDAAAAALGERTGPKRLVGYVAPKPGQAVTAQELRAHLRAALPEYAVPSALVVLEAMPLSANGKVDRKALPAPAPEAAPPGEARPATGSAERIAALLRQVLGLEALDPDANLFDYGLTSVDVNRASNLLERELGFRPPLEEVFREPTVAHLARLYDARQGAAAGDRELLEL